MQNFSEIKEFLIFYLKNEEEYEWETINQGLWMVLIIFWKEILGKKQVSRG